MRKSAAGDGRRRRSATGAAPLDVPPADEAEVARLWKLFARRRTTRTRNRLVLYYRPHAHRIVSGLLGRLHSRADKDDMRAAVDVALIRLVGKFQPSRGARFTTFMQPRLMGAILDVAREADYAGRVRRGAQNRRAVAAAGVNHRLGRRASPEELDARLGPPPPAIPQIESLDAPRRDGTLPAGTVAARRTWRANDPFWKFALRALSVDDAHAVSLYFRYGCTMRRIGELLGRSESRVSQMISCAVRQLRREAREPAVCEALLEHFALRPADALADG